VPCGLIGLRRQYKTDKKIEVKENSCILAVNKNKIMVSALFVRSDSIYKVLGVDCWDFERDARLWPGGNPAIYHPPCRAWGQLSHFAKPRPGEKELAIWSVQQIRKFGGVLEHPRASKLWHEMNLPVGKNIDKYGGFTLCVNQSWWGHKAEKKTLLYIVGVRPQDIPPMPLSFDAICFTVDRPKSNSGKKQISKKEREGTPKDFAKWLIELASRCVVNHS
jgi:hypothetical protein